MHETAPAGWDALPYGKVSLDIGRQWAHILGMSGLAGLVGQFEERSAEH